MRFILTILLFITAKLAICQPPNYVPGTQAAWRFSTANYGARNHKFFQSVLWDSAVDFTWVHFRGNGNTENGGVGDTLDNNHTLAKFLNDAGVYNWDGTVTVNGVVRRLRVLELNFNSGANYNSYEEAISYMLENCSPRTDTSAHNRMIISGFSEGPKTAFAVLTNYWGTNWPYRHCFSKGIFLSTPDLSLFTFSNLPAGFSAKWIFGTLDANAGTPPSASYQAHSWLQSTGRTSYIDSVINGTHSDNTWDVLDTSSVGQTADQDLKVWAMTLPETVTKITGIVWRDVVNMSGGYNAWTMFDEQGADPANGTNTPTPTTRSLPASANLYDTGWNNESRMYVNLRGRFKMQKIYLYVQSTFFGDTVVVYKRKHTVLNPLTAADRMATIYIAPGTNGWISANITDTCTAITIGWKGDWSSSFNVATRPDVNEIILYGQLIGSRTAAPATSYTGSYRAQVPLRQKIQDNSNNGYFNMSYAMGSSGFRIGIDGAFIPGNNLAWPNNTFNLDPFNDYANGLSYRTERYTWDSLNKIGIRPYPMLHRAMPRVTNAGCPPETWTTDSCGDNPLDISKYKIWADVMWHYAAMYGRVAVDTNLLKQYGAPRYSGLNYIDKIEPQNEIDFTQRGCDTCTSTLKYYTPYKAMLLYQMSYDGFEQRYGPRLGMAVADPSMQMQIGGTIGIDAMLIHNTVQLFRENRTDSSNKLKWANPHDYPNDGTTGIHPVQYSLRNKLNAYVDSCLAIDSTMYFDYSETGYDANSSTSPAPGSKYTVRQTGGAYTDRQKQANMYQYLYTEGWSSRFDKITLYTFVFNADESNNGDFQTAGKLKLPSYEVAPRYYVERQMLNIMGNYVFDSVINYIMDSLYVLRGHAGGDSVCLTLARPCNNGTTRTHNIWVGLNKQVKVYDLSYTSETPTVQTLTSDGSGNISVILEDKMKIAIITDLATQSNIIRTRKFKRVIQQ